MEFLRIITKRLFLLLISATSIFAQSNFYEPIDYDTVKWTYADFGNMWTFDNVPINTFETKYKFKPSQDWLDYVQKSALQFSNGCSAAFVSGDGLIMTNHHCGRNQLSGIQEKGEDLLKNGFYAAGLEQERKIENLYVDQLILIEDVTSEIKQHIIKGNTDDEKIMYRDEIKDSLIRKYSDKTGLKCKIVTLYHGGKYSLYGYKRYNDIRIVMAPDFQIAATGWDWDNFTYPRYELDFMFYRAYGEDGKPIKSENYFSWSKEGAVESEPIFVVGRPGSSDRLYSVAQLEYFRDFTYPTALIGYNSIYKAYYDYYLKHPEQEDLFLQIMRWGNSRKSYAGQLAGLKNEYIMRKKISFENDLKNKVSANPDLDSKYGNIWKSIELVINELKQYSLKNSVDRFSRTIKPVYYNIAENIIKIAKQKELPNNERDEEFRDENIDKTILDLYPEEINWELEDNLLEANLKFITSVLDSSDLPPKWDLRNIKGKAAVKYLKNKSKLSTKKDFIEFAKQSSNEIVESNDPFINYVIFIEKQIKEIKGKVNELNNTLSILNELLGEAVYYVYGDKIPPDATSTLRISDGVIKEYEYNGTIAPGKTTYYGLWDRYESFNKKTYPWGLHDKWKTPPQELDLSTSIGFASTNDIVGGNSGSSVINIKKEVVGLIHDGNLESLAGHTIYLEENNRAVATDSKGLIEALKYVYKTDRLVDELLKGKIN